jgi:hypothetical protein
MTIDNVDTGEDTTNHFTSVISAIEGALPSLRVAVARGDQPDGGLSFAMLAVKALHTACELCIEADHEAFHEMLAALHDTGDSNAC